MYIRGLHGPRPVDGVSPVVRSDTIGLFVIGGCLCPRVAVDRFLPLRQKDEKEEGVVVTLLDIVLSIPSWTLSLI